MGGQVSIEIVKIWQLPNEISPVRKKECLTGPICFPGGTSFPVTSPSQFSSFVMKRKET